MQNSAGMRADAARNVAAVIETGARLLAEDPSVCLATIATLAGVDRRTVYRHFDSRESLVDAVYRTAVDAAENAVAEARLETAPVTVALHRFAEGLITALRRYPIDLARLDCDPELSGRIAELRHQLTALLLRAADQGLVRADMPEGLAAELVYQTVALLARESGQLEPGPAADLAVDLILNGIGQRAESTTKP